MTKMEKHKYIIYNKLAKLKLQRLNIEKENYSLINESAIIYKNNLISNDIILKKKNIKLLVKNN